MQSGGEDTCQFDVYSMSMVWVIALCKLLLMITIKIDTARSPQVVGSQARILYSDQKGRVSIALAINEAVADGRVSVRCYRLPRYIRRNPLQCLTLRLLPRPQSWLAETIMMSAAPTAPSEKPPTSMMALRSAQVKLDLTRSHNAARLVSNLLGLMLKAQCDCDWLLRQINHANWYFVPSPEIIKMVEIFKMTHWPRSADWRDSQLHLNNSELYDLARKCDYYFYGSI